MVDSLKVERKGGILLVYAVPDSSFDFLNVYYGGHRGALLTRSIVDSQIPMRYGQALTWQVLISELDRKAKPTWLDYDADGNYYSLRGSNLNIANDEQKFTEVLKNTNSVYAFPIKYLQRVIGVLAVDLTERNPAGRAALRDLAQALANTLGRLLWGARREFFETELGEVLCIRRREYLSTCADWTYPGYVGLARVSSTAFTGCEYRYDDTVLRRTARILDDAAAIVDGLYGCVVTHYRFFGATFPVYCQTDARSVIDQYLDTLKRRVKAESFGDEGVGKELVIRLKLVSHIESQDVLEDTLWVLNKMTVDDLKGIGGVDLRIPLREK